ncbi:FAD-dependent oxidoreductase [Geodermatophilus sp. SYSU D00758]
MTAAPRLVVVGGSDAGISAALRARELDPGARVTVVLADEHPDLSICGLPYWVSGDVRDRRDLAHRTRAELEATGIRLVTSTRATAVDVGARTVALTAGDGDRSLLPYDELVVGTGAVPVRPPVAGLAGLGPADGVHVLHSMGDAVALQETLRRVLAAPAPGPRRALVVGAGYVGLEMAEALTARGLEVVQVEALPEVLPTVDPPLGRLVRDELTRHGVRVHTGTTVTAVSARPGGRHPLHADATGPAGEPLGLDVDVVLVVVGVRPDTDLLTAAGARTGPRGAVLVDETMATGLPHVWAAGDCVVTHHRLAGVTWLPLGTTAHKQGRVAGENAVGGTGRPARFAGSLGTQVVKVFDVVAARTGLREPEALAAGHRPGSTTAAADDHKAYYPGARPVTVRLTGDTRTGRLLGAQMVGALGTATAKRVDTCATALFHGTTVDGLGELDLSYTPPLGSPWDVVQVAAHAWVAEHAPRRPAARPQPAGAPA